MSTSCGAMSPSQRVPFPRLRPLPNEFRSHGSLPTSSVSPFPQTFPRRYSTHHVEIALYRETDNAYATGFRNANTKQVIEDDFSEWLYQMGRRDERDTSPAFWQHHLR